MGEERKNTKEDEEEGNENTEGRHDRRGIKREERRVLVVKPQA